MGNVITTYENLISDFAIADYSACKFFVPFSEGSGATVAELVAGQTMTLAGLVAGDILWAGNYIYTDDVAAAGTDATITMPDLGTTKDHLTVVVADFDADSANISLGSGTTEPMIKVDRKAATPGTRITDTTPNTDTFLASAADANTQAIAIYTDRNNTRGAGAASCYIDETDGATVVAQETLALTAVDGMNLDTAGKIVFSTDVKIYGIAIFSFSAPPPSSDVLSALSWMNYQWRQGNKVIYPGWKNKT